MSKDVKVWIGHGEKIMSDDYPKIQQETAKRQQWAEKGGLGFNSPAEKIVTISAVKSNPENAV